MPPFEDDPEIQLAVQVDVLKIVLRELIVALAQSKGGGRHIPDDLRRNCLKSIVRLKLDDEDHVSVLQEMMKEFHQSFFNGIDEARLDVEHREVDVHVLGRGLSRSALELTELANRKGFKINRATTRGHWRLTGPDGGQVTNPESKAAAFSVEQAMAILNDQPDRAN